MSSTRSRTRSADPAATADRERALKLWVVLARAHAAVVAHVEAHVASHGLTVAEFGVLEALYHKGPLLLGDVQRKILVSSGGVTFLVDRLTAKGLVERQICEEDRRARYAALTRDGERLMRRIFPEHAAMLERTLGMLAPDDQATATDLLRQLGRGAAELEPHAG